MPEMKSAANLDGAAPGPPPGRRNSAAAELAALALDVPQAFSGAASPPWSLAAPSCVLPADVGRNCTALAPFFPELGLCFFETAACLAYGEADLPRSLAALPVRWHLHLPLDLPWGEGTPAVAGVILALAEKVAELAPWAYVLHPPRQPETLRDLALALAAGGLPPGSLLVENIQGRDLERMWPVVRELDLGACLDLGHMLEHGQQDFLDLPGLWAHARMLHLNAPDTARPVRHAPLDRLDDAGRAVLGRMLSSFAPGGSVLLELFSPRELFDSLRYLSGYWAGLGASHKESA